MSDRTSMDAYSVSTDESSRTHLVRNSYSSNDLDDNSFEFAHVYPPTMAIAQNKNHNYNDNEKSQQIRKCQSVIQLTSTGRSLLNANECHLSRNHRHTIQIPVAASRLRLPIPTPSSVLMAIKQENFLATHLKKFFARCQVINKLHKLNTIPYTQISMIYCMIFFLFGYIYK